MAVLELLAAGAREIAARSLELQARQDGPTSITNPAASATSSLSSTTSPTSTSSTATNGSNASTTLGGALPSDSNKPFEQSHDSATSPLLFFVALGFGVVFTNLWIIVGVKYCFRYNARNRQLRMAEEGDPVALENMPRPHRRRREKKLMTMDEVNEKFPMQKYKNWVASRAQEGLPTRGGISAPPSRANSVRSVEGVAPEPPSKERSSDDERPTTSSSAKDKAGGLATETGSKDDQVTNAKQIPGPDETGQASTAVMPPSSAPQAPVSTPASVPAPMTTQRSSLDRVDSEDDNDDEHINAALPPECIGTNGDACAICIETLEDDDDVRGLSCGHAFHAVCLDPWLTSRRACCPLCKADYYTPKPRPPPADGAAGNNATFNDMAQNNSRLNMPGAPQTAWVTLTGRGRWFLPSSLRTPRQPSSPTQSRQNRNRRARRRPTATTAQVQQEDSVVPSSPAITTQQSRAQSGNFMSNLRPTLPRIRMPQFPRLGRHRDGEDDTSSTPAVATTSQATTPSQLEAGNAPATSTRA